VTRRPASHEFADETLDDAWPEVLAAGAGASGHGPSPVTAETHHLALCRGFGPVQADLLLVNIGRGGLMIRAHDKGPGDTARSGSRLGFAVRNRWPAITRCAPISL